jgi:hypothetical protein
MRKLGAQASLTGIFTPASSSVIKKAFANSTASGLEEYRGVAKVRRICPCRSQEIMNEIAALDAESAEVLANIKALL